MIINHNISALNTYRQLSINNNAGNRSLEKLSSGYRINRAGDDAAGLAISEKMRGQIRGLDMAAKNAQDGISLIQTAEGALNETHSILQRMRELAVQSANSTNTDSDREEIQKEIEQLKSEIDRISTDTEFNTKALLDGSIANTAELVAEENAAKLTAVEVIDDNLIVSGNYNINFSEVDVNYEHGGLEDIGADLLSYNAADSTAFNLAIGTYTLTVEHETGTSYRLTLADKATGEVVGIPQEGVNIAPTESADGVATVFGFTLTWNAGESAAVAEGSIDITITADFVATVTGPDGEGIGTTTVSDNTDGVVNVGGFKINFDNFLAEGDTIVETEANAVSFQIGANEGQMTKLAISDMSSNALGVDAIDLTSADNASNAITTIDKAIQSVSAERAKLGAIQNRLDHTINNLGTSSENLTAAESRIRDVDMAKEMMEYAKNTILQQAAQAMLAQANQQPQGVLQLLR